MEESLSGSILSLPLCIGNVILSIESPIADSGLKGSITLGKEGEKTWSIDWVKMPYRKCKECKKVWYSSDTTERTWDCPECKAGIGPELEIDLPNQEEE